EKLNQQEKSIVQKLMELAGGQAIACSKKRKCMVPKFSPTKTSADQVGRHRRQEEPQTKANATLAQRIEILNWYHTNGKNQSWTANHFNKIYPFLHLKQPKISDWLKHEASWRAEYEGTSAGVAHSVKRVRQTQHPKVTEMLDLWVSKAMADKLLLTGEVIRQKWKAFADRAGVPTDKCISLSEGWLSRYKVRNGLKQTKCHGEAASASPQTVYKERLCMQGLIKNGGYKLRDVFNADESRLFYA
ncbi:hypothetical protein PAXRUDRAFT_171064, partial [Paxillus rubicundulus Ve08.2h10]